MTIFELMGHKTIQMTKRCAHLAPAHNQAAVDRLVSFQMREACHEPDTWRVEPTAITSATELKSTHMAQRVWK